MEINLLGVDTSVVTDRKDYGPLDDGWYGCKVESAEATLSKAGNKMVTIKFSVCEGPRAGAWHRHRFMLTNATNDQKKINRARANLALIAKACGFIDPQSATEADHQRVAIGRAEMLTPKWTPGRLVGKFCRIKLGFRKTEEYEKSDGGTGTAHEYWFNGAEAMADDHAATSQPAASGTTPTSSADFSDAVPF